MKRWLRTIGLLPPLLAAAVFALLAALTILRADPERPASWSAVPDAWLDGLQALRQGDAAAALPQLRLAEAEVGVAPPALLRARLHAALLAGDGVDAEATAEKLALRSGADALREFAGGVAEYERCRIAALQARQQGADPAAFDRALRHAAAAALAFQAASLLHPQRDWPAARRNAERALAQRAELQRQKEQAERDRKREPDQPQPDPQPEPQPVEQEIRRPDDPGLLSLAELQAMLQRLLQAEDEKRAVRRSAGNARSAGVEQDW